VIGRTVSWAAHYIEQQQLPQPIRPRGTYAGPANRSFEPLDERS
jgi:citrate synthase/2-methylcitrate synthase